MTISNEGPTCPYCQTTITPDEAFYFGDDYAHEECPECGEKFKVEYHRLDSWFSEKLPKFKANP